MAQIICPEVEPLKLSHMLPLAAILNMVAKIHF